MKQSALHIRTRKESPSDETSKSAQLLIRAGYVHKEMAGAYTWLPLGLRTLRKVENIVRKHMDTLGSQEILLTALQNKETWEKTNRWSDEVVDNWFKTTLKNDTELGLGFTHEEPLTALLKNHITSYRDLPFSMYQIQTKFRNELRAKSGVMRGREFLMKDLYSFSRNAQEHDAFYERVKQTYTNIFNELGIGDRTYATFASGGVFSKYSHEFQTVTDAGEDIIYVDEGKKIAINKEVLTDVVCADLGVNRNTLIEKKSVEVGNIFSLGTKFSEPLELLFVDEDGTRKPVVMGSYGIGIGRLVGVLAEVFSEVGTLNLPVSVAPFVVHLLSIDGKLNPEFETSVNVSVREQAQKIYDELVSAGVEVLFDDRDKSAGEKLADADLIGIPHRLIISKRSIQEGGVEFSAKWRTPITVKVADILETVRKTI